MKFWFAVTAITLAVLGSSNKRADIHIVITNSAGQGQRSATCQLVRTDPNEPKHFWLECTNDDQ